MRKRLVLAPANRWNPPARRFPWNFNQADQSIFDGIQRPLTVIAEKYGMHITRGVEVPEPEPRKGMGF